MPPFLWLYHEAPHPLSRLRQASSADSAAYFLIRINRNQIFELFSDFDYYNNSPVSSLGKRGKFDEIRKLAFSFFIPLLTLCLNFFSNLSRIWYLSFYYLLTLFMLSPVEEYFLLPARSFDELTFLFLPAFVKTSSFV